MGRKRDVQDAFVLMSILHADIFYPCRMLDKSQNIHPKRIGAANVQCFIFRLGLRLRQSYKRGGWAVILKIDSYDGQQPGDGNGPRFVL